MFGPAPLPALKLYVVTADWTGPVKLYVSPSPALFRSNVVIPPPEKSTVRGEVTSR